MGGTVGVGNEVFLERCLRPPPLPLRRGLTWGDMNVALDEEGFEGNEWNAEARIVSLSSFIWRGSAGPSWVSGRGGST